MSDITTSAGRSLQSHRRRAAAVKKVRTSTITCARSLSLTTCYVRTYTFCCSAHLQRAKIHQRSPHQIALFRLADRAKARSRFYRNTSLDRLINSEPQRSLMDSESRAVQLPDQVDQTRVHYRSAHAVLHRTTNAHAAGVAWKRTHGQGTVHAEDYTYHPARLAKAAYHTV